MLGSDVFEIPYLKDSATARLVMHYVGYTGMIITLLLSYYTLYMFVITVGDEKYATGKLEEEKETKQE